MNKPGLFRLPTMVVAGLLLASALTVAPAASAATVTATWSSPAVDLSELGGDAFDPQVALSADGTTATAVWRRFNGSNSIVQSASATITGSTATWAAAVDLSASGRNASVPQVTLSADGTKATAVWIRFDGSNNIVQSTSATITGSTATWSAPVDLSAPGQSAAAPQVALSADGTRATAAWARYDGSNNIVQSTSATITGSTATWSAAVDLSAPGRDADRAQVALSADGTRATAVWRRSNGSRDIVQSTSATITGSTATWAAAVDLSASSEDANDPQVALSADGTRATAVWARDDSSNVTFQSKSATVNGSTATWSAAVDLSVPSLSGGNPQVTLSADGTKATAVWRLFNGSSVIVQSASASIAGSTATWSAPVDLSAPGGDAYKPQVALSADGTRATAVWHRYANAVDVDLVQSSSAIIPRPPGAPTDVMATAGDQQVTLSWAPPLSDGSSAITTYTVTGIPAGRCTTTGATSCVISGLSNGTPHSFTVVATNALGDGPASASVTATPESASASVNTTVPAVDGTTVPTTPAIGPVLPETGGEPGRAAAIAVVLLATGLLTAAASRRRRVL
jgi:hypothetical protein